MTDTLHYRLTDQVENGFNTKVKLDSPMLLHHGELYTIGDIIRITGEDDIIYYGEILQFWSDAYTEKFVTVQWLIPKMNIGQDGLKFIPAKYTHGTPCQRIYSYVTFVLKRLFGNCTCVRSRSSSYRSHKCAQHRICHECSCVRSLSHFCCF